MKTIFLIPAAFFAVFSIIANRRRKDWKWICLHLFVYLVQFPLWLLFGLAVLMCFPALVYSLFPGSWFCVGMLLWIVPHCCMTVLAVRKKDRPDAVCAVSGICAISCVIALFIFGM